jgi:TPP-dependent pyruvate/acetoin dehydrogenase alpha subunit
LLTEKDREELAAAALEESKMAFERAESEADPSLEDTFRHTFASLPPVLERQLQRRKRS